MGKKLKQNLKELIEHIRDELPRRFEASTYVKRRAKIVDNFQNARMGLLRKMNSVAVDKGFNLDMDESGGLTLYPLVEGKRLSEEEFDRLDTTLRLSLKSRGDNLVQAMSGYMRQLNKAEESFQDDERGLEREAMTQVLTTFFNPIEQRMLKACPVKGLDAYFTALREDILKNTDAFLQRDGGPLGDPHGAPVEAVLYRYEVNLLVDNSGLDGAPIIVEDHPTAVNLLGCVERESEMGALVTDFTLIRAGSIHKANGGFLVLHIEDLLQHPNAWEGLLRALRSNMARIEDSGEGPDTPIRTKGINPEPLPLNLKVVLIGDEELYEGLLVNDDRFSKLFRIKAHMADTTERNAANVRAYLGHIATIIKETELPCFDRTALAWLIDLGSHICEDQRRLSLRFPELRELMIEASALTRMRRYHAGSWYPFADAQGRITDPKTTVVVGAILCALADGHLEGFSFDSGALKLTSTARYIGEMDINSQLKRPKVWFTVDVDSKDGTDKTRAVAFSGPLSIGYRQLDAERWPTTRYHLLTFATEEARSRASGRLPYRVEVSLSVADALDEEDIRSETDKDRRSEGEFRIDSIVDCQERSVDRRDLEIRLQTLKLDEGYWLDTGIVTDAG